MKNRIAKFLLALGYLFVRNHQTSVDHEGDYRFRNFHRGPVEFWTFEGRFGYTASLLVRVGGWDLLYVHEAEDRYTGPTYRIVGIEHRPNF